MRQIRRVSALSLALLVFVGCKPDPAPTTAPRASEKSLNDDPAPTADSVDGTAMPSAPAEQAALKVSQGSPLYLVDGSGRALYFLEDNAGGKRCDARCEEAWPPAIVDAKPKPGDGVRPDQVGALPSRTGSSQITYGGKSLYRYSGDSGAGTTNGHGVSDQWGKWSLMDPNGQALKSKPAK